VSSQVHFAPFTPEYFKAYVETFLAIAADQPSEYWTSEHFLMNVPGKWRLSFAVDTAAGAGPIGYAILSQPTAQRVHLHHFMLAPSNRGAGLGTRMLSECARRATEAGAEVLTLKVSREATRAVAFYETFGFEIVDRGGEHLFGRLQLPPT